MKSAVTVKSNQSWRREETHNQVGAAPARGGPARATAALLATTTALVTIAWLAPTRLASQSPPAQPAATSIVAIEGATLIDGTGAAPLADSAVLIRGNRIEAVGRRGSVSIPAGARRVDASSRFLIPGLMDSHAHAREGWMDELFLLHGVTSVQNEPSLGEWDLAQQDARAKGMVRGPRFYTALPGFACRMEACYGPDYQPDQIRTRVREMVAAGAKKIAMTWFEPPDVIKVIVEEAHKHGLSVTGHTLFIREASAFGFDAVTHTYAIAMGAAPDEARQKVINAMYASRPADVNPLTYLVPPASTELRDRLLKAKVYLVPMVVEDFKAINDRVVEFRQDARKLFEDPQLAYVPAEHQDRYYSVGLRSVPPLGGGAPTWYFGTGYYGTDNPRTKDDEPHRRNYRNIMKFLGEYAAGGGKILVGTDVGNWAVPGLSVLQEMQLLHDAGLTPMQALQAATLWPAESIHQEGDIGSIRPGRFADLVILDRNPLDDIANVKRIRSVFLNGVEQEMKYHGHYENPIPSPLRASGLTLRSVSPTLLVEGSRDVELTVRGTFTEQSVVTVNDVRVPTRFVQRDHIVAMIPPAMLEHAGTLRVRVVSPEGFLNPGTSAPLYVFVKFK